MTAAARHIAVLVALVAMALSGFAIWIGHREQIAAMSALTAGERVQFLTDRTFRQEITPKVNAAGRCLLAYAGRDPEGDAGRDARRTHPRFYWDFFNGDAAGTEPTGLGRCNMPTIDAVSPNGWQELDEYQSITGDGDYRADILDRCLSAALDYGTRYNRALARLRPDALARSCAPSVPMTRPAAAAHQ